MKAEDLRIAQICADFVAAWESAGQRPALEDYIPADSDRSHSLLIKKLVSLEIRIRRSTGESPNVSEYLQRFPGISLEQPELASDVPPYGVLATHSLDSTPPLASGTHDTASGRPDPDTTLSYVAGADGNFIVPSSNAHAPIEPGVILNDRYYVDRLIGAGGMGKVFLGRDHRLQRRVAIKVMRSCSSRDRETLDRAFLEEAAIGANLEHESIARVYDFGIQEGCAFTVFQYIPGDTLRTRIQQGAPFPLEEVHRIVAPLARALDFAHASGVVHRDLKPENIIITDNGPPKILDLGLATHFQRDETWRFAGTPAYASPEQFLEQPSDGRTDQYSLAVVVYELLTGRRPFVGTSVNELRELHTTSFPTPPSAIKADIPPECSLAVLRALSKEPHRRFASCEEFAAAIGCQIERLTAAPLHVIREFHAPLVWGPAFLTGFLSAHVGVTDSALYYVTGDKVQVWPFRSIIEVTHKGRSLWLTSHSKQTPALRTRIRLPTHADCEMVYADVREACSRLTPEENHEFSYVCRTCIPLVKNSVLIGVQLLSTVSVTSPHHWHAIDAVRLRAAMLGGDAVVDAQKQQYSSFGSAACEVSGQVVRTTREETRNALHRSGIGQNAFRLGGRLLIVEALTATVNIATMAFMAVAASFLATPRPNIGAPRYTVAIYSLVGLALTLHAPPMAGIVLLMGTQWHQLAVPAAAMFLVLSIFFLARHILILTTLFGTLGVFFLLDPWQMFQIVFEVLMVHLGFAYFCSARNLSRQARGLRVAMNWRDGIGVLASTGAVIYGLVLMAIALFTIYQLFVIVANPKT